MKNGGPFSIAISHRTILYINHIYMYISGPFSIAICKISRGYIVLPAIRALGRATGGSPRPVPFQPSKRVRPITRPGSFRQDVLGSHKSATKKREFMVVEWGESWEILGNSGGFFFATPTEIWFALLRYGKYFRQLM